MRPAADHDKQFQRITNLQSTLDKFRALTGAATDPLREATQPHLTAAAQLRNAAQVAVDQHAARARRLPEQLATGEISLDQVATHLASLGAWAPPAGNPKGKPAGITIADQAARYHEADAIAAAKAAAPQLYALLGPFARTAVAGADKATRKFMDVATIAEHVRQLKVPAMHSWTPQKGTAKDQQEAIQYLQLFRLIHSTGNVIRLIEGGHQDPMDATFDVPVSPRHYQFLTRNVDDHMQLAVAVELGWQPGFYPPDQPKTPGKASRVATKAGAVIRAMAGAH
ncbi:hypothetical protein [Micromonospora sp. DH14]|uniref:hypothetical protein n=1 Tax=Micromonospora sp. DH14 TaxID=3040120 RepID=UPI0024416F54|nr:hypothetical protein [Micromonospora sp. DH14]MDG9673029.1 hypothetical protein [Micromonospora sp. DH14]